MTGTNFLNTPDGRSGWADFFLDRGYEVSEILQLPFFDFLSHGNLPDSFSSWTNLPGQGRHIKLLWMGHNPHTILLPLNHALQRYQDTIFGHKQSYTLSGLEMEVWETQFLIISMLQQYPASLLSKRQQSK